MQNWLRGQNKFTRWTAMGTATSAATGMAAVAALIIAMPHVTRKMVDELIQDCTRQKE